MIIRNPLPFHDRDTAEIPAVQPDTRVPLLLDTSTNPCPYWHVPEPKRHIDLSKIDYEKLAGRVLLIGMGLFTLLVSIILLWKVIVLVINFK